MKKIYFAFIAFMLSSCFVMSCKASSNKAQAADTLVVETDSCILKEGKTLDCTFRADFPTGTDELSQSVREVLNQKLAEAFLAPATEEEGKNYKAYSGDLSNGNVVLEKYCKDNFDYLKAQMEDVKKFEPAANVFMNYEVNLTLKEENEHYITYNQSSYAYLAGAHGSSFDNSFNIVKETGKLLTQTVDTTQVKALQPILRKGVLSYLNEYNKEDPVTDKTLNEYLFIANGIIPLPAHTPCLTKDGVHFAYQQYEIGPYAMGIVEFTVPYAEIKPYLVSEVQQLLK